MSGPAEVSDAVVEAIHSGDIEQLRLLLAEHPGVASAPLGGRHGSGTPLRAVTDWPGYFPNGPEIVRLLVAAGADPNAREPGEETPLHWAASSDDWHVAAALIDAGGDINAPRRFNRHSSRQRGGVRVLGCRPASRRARRRH